jgi:hypothetical protein
MRRRVVGFLVLAQVSFFACLSVAVVMTTAGFQHNHGLSFYGEHWSTAVPYGAGFMLCDYFLLLAANALPKDDRRCRRLALLLNLLTVSLLIVLLTPDTVDSFFNWSHSIASANLFVYELSFAAWLARRCYADGVVWSLIVLQLVAAVLAMLSNFHVVPYLSEGTLIFQLIFSVVLIREVAGFLRVVPAPGATQGPGVPPVGVGGG